MGSQVQAKKRAFVKILLRIAALYRFVCNVNRDSSDAELGTAFRKVSAKCHPDKGGDAEHSKQLNAARDEWKKSQKEATASPTAPAIFEKGFRIHSQAVLLTYNGIQDMTQWERFLIFFEGNLREWRVKHWCATLEANREGKLHIHAMVQFTHKVDMMSKRFAFEGIAPNAGVNNKPGEDLLGEGLCRKSLQSSINRGMFYAFANKKGTARDAEGRPVVAGNYFPCWVDAKITYKVQARWCDSLWHAHKLDHDVYEDWAVGYILLVGPRVQAGPGTQIQTLAHPSGCTRSRPSTVPT